MKKISLSILLTLLVISIVIWNSCIFLIDKNIYFWIIFGILTLLIFILTAISFKRLEVMFNNIKQNIEIEHQNRTAIYEQFKITLESMSDIHSITLQKVNENVDNLCNSVKEAEKINSEFLIETMNDMTKKDMSLLTELNNAITKNNTDYNRKIEQLQSSISDSISEIKQLQEDLFKNISISLVTLSTTLDNSINQLDNKQSTWNENLQGSFNVFFEDIAKNDMSLLSALNSVIENNNSYYQQEIEKLQSSICKNMPEMKQLQENLSTDISDTLGIINNTLNEGINQFDEKQSEWNENLQDSFEDFFDAYNKSAQKLNVQFVEVEKMIQDNTQNYHNMFEHINQNIASLRNLSENDVQILEKLLKVKK